MRNLLVFLTKLLPYIIFFGDKVKAYLQSSLEKSATYT